MKYIYLVIFSTLSLCSFGQEKEIFIIGTMHTVPKIVKNSYRPLLKVAKKYNPDAIYVETNLPSDTVSLNNDAQEFVVKSDSLKSVFTLNNKRFENLNNKDLDKFTADDYEFMTKTYIVKRDYANYYFYNYLTRYGIQGSKKPLRHENGDLSSKLAIALNIKYLYSMDDQKTRKEYHTAWEECVELGAKNGDNDIINKMSRKSYKRSIIPALLGRLGKYTNRLETLNTYHVGNSFRYVQNTSTSCEDGQKYWDGRNNRMARNIGKQVIHNSNKKNIVIVGAGHVVGLKEALEKNYPELRIKIMDK